MGDPKQANLNLVAPSAGGPEMLLKDDNGYGLTLGRTDLLNIPTGDLSFTSAASIVATSKNSTVHWPLLKPELAPTGDAKKSHSQ